MTDVDPISQPVLNTPYQKPAHYWELGIDNRALNRTATGRRPSIALLPVPKSRENVVEQPVLPLGPENYNATVNAIRDGLVWPDLVTIARLERGLRLKLWLSQKNA